MDPAQQQQAAAPAAAPQAAPAAAPGQKDDYFDKGADAAAKRAGIKLDKGTREKITDGLRKIIEKFTGKKVPEKVSN